MRHWSRKMRRWASLAAAVAVLSCMPSVGRAWKPYTHNTSALEAYYDALDGFVEIEGAQYAVAAGVAEALRLWPAYYNAGVIGPDGFPDLTYGQSVIHPGSSDPEAPTGAATGEWLRLVFTKAQEAQTDTAYSATERQQILAFAYGYLTHAAGDMWGHSFINDFARGVFPGVSEIASSPAAASIAARHIIAEGYVGDATPGFDGDRATRDTLPGDVSDDATPGFPYAAPNRFLYQTLIRPGGTPTAARGPIIDFFVDIDRALSSFSTGTPGSVAAAVQAYDEASAALTEMQRACAGGLSAECLLAVGQAAFDNLTAFFAEAVAEVDRLARLAVSAYVAEWRRDIDTGLQNWGQFGLATTKGLFDAQTRRDLQNANCAQETIGGFSLSETSLVRVQCEGAVGMVDTVLASSNTFINDHLLSMAGLPDAAGGTRAALQDISALIAPILNAADLPFNPIAQLEAQIRAEIQNLIADALTSVLGVDIRTLQEFLTQPHRFTCVESVQLPLPGGGTRDLDLFRTGDHHRLDDLLGLTAAHHVPPEEANPLPADCMRLTDSASFQSGLFRAMRNTVTTAKLLLLDGNELNRVLSTLRGGRAIDTYQVEQNVMVQQFPNLASGVSWLRSIDGDHAWRQDGHPRFCNEGGVCYGTAVARPAGLNGGAGSFPIWESCVLRPAFRALYRDWEADTAAFPAFGDEVSSDNPNDPDPPLSRLVQMGALFIGDSGTAFIAADHSFTQSAADGPEGRAFAASELSLRRRITLDGAAAGVFAAAAQNETFTLGTQDGRYRIVLQAADPCHDFLGALGAAEPERESVYVLDTTAPVISCAAPPFGGQFDSDDQVTVDFAITDGALGSGVAASSATIDGYAVLPGVVPTSDGAALNMAQFYPGTRTVSIASRDHLQHAGALQCSFVVRATAASLQTNVRDARVQGLITTDSFMNSLLDTLRIADRQHRRGQHPTEWNALEAFVSQVMAQSGKSVDSSLATRLIAFARDIIATRS